MKQLNEAVRSELDKLGLVDVKEVRYNLDKTGLSTQAILHNHGVLTDSGALVVNTAPFTGRSPNDKYLIDHGDPDQDDRRGRGESGALFHTDQH